ncbi:response regulator transcription factor [Streptomyces sp. NPDC059371]|uniref:response regulator transcription factor n=1 Tax=Streptomyces sp. NPDC059371 TaxID=3346812 RepID=UPI0036BD18EB
MGTSTAPGRSRLRVLVVEDDETIGHHLETGLRGNGYAAAWIRTGVAALTEAGSAAYDAVLLDLGLPDIDGLDVARDLRARFPDLLIVILTARTDDIDIIAGLEAGADDYLVKPFSLTVLLARLRAHVRRRAVTATEQPPVQLDDLVIDTTARRCTLHGEEITLRPKEFELLVTLARHPGAAVARETLMAEVWDENWFGPTKTLDVTMASLRRRLAQAADASSRPCRLPRIVTLRGHGYRLEG